MLGTVFDHEAEWFDKSRLRPHWMQAGTVTFITFRSRDSIPKEVVRQWDAEKTEWLLALGLTVPRHWSDTVGLLSPGDKSRFDKHFERTREAFLDTCHGECVLRRPEIANIVAETLLFFDGERYGMGDFVVMPNHVHLLAAFATAEAMAECCDSWLHFSARKINLFQRTKGNFWQREPFDHLIRTQEQYELCRRYIYRNPEKANIRRGEYLYRRLPDA